MNEPYVFVSYAHADSARVFPILEGMRRSGIRFWYDTGIEAGSEWPTFIAEKVLGCCKFLSFISPAYIDSQNCYRELNYAVSKRKPLLSVFLEDLELPPGVEMQLGSYQALFCNRFSDTDSFIASLCREPFFAPCLGGANDSPPVNHIHAPVSNYARSFTITGLIPFAADGTDTGRKLFENTFAQKTTRYIGVRVAFPPITVARTVQLRWTVYKDGLMLSQEMVSSVSLAVGNDYILSHQWGWDEPGHWPAGQYLITVTVDDSETAQTTFTVTAPAGAPAPTDSHIRAVRLFESGDDVPPREQCRFAYRFSRAQTRRIGFLLDIDIFGRQTNIDIQYRIFRANGDLFCAHSVPVRLGPTDTYCWANYGWPDPGHWPIGRYTYTVALGNTTPVRGSFEICR